MKGENQKTILLVEDEAITALAEQMTLEKYGYRVLVACSGEEAIAAVEKTPAIDLILMDINLGAGMDGTQATAIILGRRDLPVVFLSSHMEPEIVAKTEKITSYGYVVKNSSMTVLDASIKMAFKLFAAKIKEKEKEAALRESEASYRVLFSGASDGILLADAQTRQFRYANPAICRMLGYTEDEFQRISVADIHPKESLDHVLAEFAALAQGETRSSPELPCLRKDGTVFYADISHSAVTLEGREYHAGFFHDITERKRAEETVFQSKKDWEECFDSITDMITIHDNDYNIVRANKAGKALLKLPALEEHLKLKCFSFYHGADAPPAGCPSCECLRSGMPTTFELFEPYLDRYLEIRALPRFDSNNRQSGLIHIVRDISERKQANDALKENELRLKAQYRGMPVPTFTWRKIGDDFELIDFNDAARTITQERTSGFAGRKASDLYAGRQDILHDLQRCSVEGKVIKRETLSEHFIPGKHIALTIVPIPADLIMVHMEDISERKRVEAEKAAALEALQKSEEKFRGMAEQLEDVLFTTDNYGSVTYISPSASRVFGWHPEEMIGRKFVEFLPESEIPKAIHAFQTTISTGQPNRNLNLLMKRRDNTIFTGELKGSPLDKKWGFLGTLGLIRDITEYKKAEVALQESEERYRTLIENASDLVYRTDKAGRFTFVNRAGLTFTGYEEGELIGKFYPSLIRPDMRNRAVKIFLHQIRMRTPNTYSEFPILAKDGRELWVGQNIQLVMQNGQVAGFQAVSRDITERKQAEAQKEAALEALRESEDRYRDLVENSQDLICTHDLEGKILSMNETAVRLTGYPLQELLGMNMADLLVPEVRHLFKAYVTEIQAKGWSRGTMRIQTASGEHRYWEYYNTLRTRDVTVPVVRALGHDITERERAEKIQHVQYVIANAMIKADTLASLLETVRSELSSLIDTTNFLLALYDEASGMLSAPFERDEKDAIPQWPAEKSLTGLVIKQKRSLLLREEAIRQLDEAGTTKQVGSNAKAWLGVPLQINEKVLGAIVVQSYDKAFAYDQNGVNFLEIIANQLSAYIERKQAEKALRESEEQFRSLYENSTFGIYRTIPSGKIIMANPALIKMLGYSTFAEVEARDLQEDWFQPSHPRRQFIEKFAEQDEVTGLEAAWKRRDGSTIFIREGARAVRNAQGDILYFDGTVEDITGRKQAEVEIQRQLAEKAILLKEVHHRIKNNIASVSALLSLRLQSITNPEAVPVLQDAIGRVNSIRLLYDKLLLNEDYRDISVKNYVEDLSDLVVALFPGSAKVRIDKRIDDFHMDEKRLFPLGIIINEILTNAMKYAFSDAGPGLITISLALAGNHVTLTIKDNGIGLPEGFDVNESKGFGLMLVKMLSQQLGGKFSMEKRAGTRCVVEFDL